MNVKSELLNIFYQKCLTMSSLILHIGAVNTEIFQMHKVEERIFKHIIHFTKMMKESDSPTPFHRAGLRS